MFETNDAAEMKMPLDLFNNGERVWHIVQLRLHVPWFYLVYQVTHSDGIKISSMIFITDIEQVIDLMSDTAIDLLEAYLVSPGHLNKKDCWKMEKLKAVWSATHKNESSMENSYATIYVLHNNSEYVYNDTESDSEMFTKDELILNLERPVN